MPKKVERKVGGMMKKAGGRKKVDSKKKSIKKGGGSNGEKRNNIKLLTTTMVDENKYEAIGVVMGVSVRAISSLRQLFSGVASIFGGRRGELEKKLIEAREEAIQEMKDNATSSGADIVYGVHIDTSELSRGNSDGFLVVSATGTGFKIKK